MLCECVKHTSDKRACWVTEGNTPQNYLNILCNKPTFLSKINSSCIVTLDLFVSFVKCLCGQQTCTSILENSCRLTIGYHLKVCQVRKGWRWCGWLRNRFPPFWMHYFWPKYILIVSQYISLSIYTKFNTLIWKFNPFRGVLGRISALIIEVLSNFYTQTRSVRNGWKFLVAKSTELAL